MANCCLKLASWKPNSYPPKTQTDSYGWSLKDANSQVCQKLLGEALSAQDKAMPRIVQELRTVNSSPDAILVFGHIYSHERAQLPVL